MWLGELLFEDTQPVFDNDYEVRGVGHNRLCGSRCMKRSVIVKKMLLKCNNLFHRAKDRAASSCVGDLDVYEPRETTMDNNMRALQIIKQVFKTCVFMLLVRMTFCNDVCSLCVNAVPFLSFSPGCTGAAVLLLC